MSSEIPILPVEILIQILSFKSTQIDLVKLSLLNSSFCYAAQHLLYSKIKITSLESFDLLFRTLDRRLVVIKGKTSNEESTDHLIDFDWNNDNNMTEIELGRANSIRTVEIKCTQYGVKGWGIRISHLMRLCLRIQHLTLIGIEDLRVKYLSGVGELRTLCLQTTTFRANSLPSSPHLYQTLSNLSSLRLLNLGLPSPCLHPLYLLSNSPALKHIEISDFRDLTPDLFQSALISLASTSPLLQSLKLGNLTEAQQLTLPFILPKFTSLILINFLSPWTWMSNADFQVLPSSVQTIKLSSIKKEYCELDQWQPVLEALSKGFGRKAKKLEVSNLYGWLRAEPLEKLRKGVESAGLTFSARLA